MSGEQELARIAKALERLLEVQQHRLLLEAEAVRYQGSPAYVADKALDTVRSQLTAQIAEQGRTKTKDQLAAEGQTRGLPGGL